jgi:biotin carboxyl carrier protein
LRGINVDRSRSVHEWRNLKERVMSDVKVTENLWATSMLPEGLLERWLVSEGAMVSAGEPIAQVRIEDALHDILAPSAGRLRIAASANDVLEPGATLGQVTP